MDEIAGRSRERALDVELGALSTRQHGTVAHAQLRELGLSQDAIDRRLAQGRLIRIWPRAYAVGDLAIPAKGRVMAATLTSGPGAVASGHTAAWLLDLLERPQQIEVTGPRRRRPKPGLRLRVEPIAVDERMEIDEIPATNPSRTIFDLARSLDVPALRAVVDEARRRGHRLDPPLSELLDRYRGRPGARVLRALLSEMEANDGVTRSAFEAAFLPFVRSIGLPAPAVNHRVRCGNETYLLDIAWPRLKLAVELDGHRFHSSRAQLERDKRRDRKLGMVGYRVIRVTWTQFQRGREELAGDLWRTFQRAYLEANGT